MSRSDLDGIRTALQIFSTNIDQQDYLGQFKSIEKTLAQFQNTMKTVTESAWSIPSYSFNIPSEIDIFSELSEEVYDETNNKQMAILLRKFKKVFYERFQNKQPDIVLPKLSYFIDGDDAHMIRLASMWEQGDVMLYFSFEKSEIDSSYGLIWNDKARKNYESRTGNIYLNDEEEIVHEVCDFIFRVFA